MIYTPFITFSMLLACSRAQITPSQLDSYDSNAVTGKATYYGGNPTGGACGYADVPTSSFPFGTYAACGSEVFDSGYGCGRCFEIECIGPDSPNPSCYCSSTTPKVIVSCMDQCPECSSTHFDLNPSAMERIVGPGLAGTCGIIETRIKRVPCDYTGNIKIRSKSGTSTYWYGLHVDDVAGYGSVTSVKIKSSVSSAYATTCDHSEGASFWKCNGGYPLSTPLSLELTNDHGETITCTNCINSVAADTEFDFGSNFGVAAVPSTSSTPQPTTDGTNPLPTPTPTPANGTPQPTPASNQGYIGFEVHSSSNDYYFSVLVRNIDASNCNDGVASMGFYYADGDTWWTNNQYYYEDSVQAHRYAWDYQQILFSLFEPISLKIVMNSGREILFWGIIESNTPGNTYISTELICDGTLSPTAPTPEPTTRAPTAPTTPYPTAESVCIDEDALHWRSYNNQLYLNGNRFNMKGLSWFGYETPNNGLYGLDKHSEEWYFQWMVDHGFNAMRLPFSGQFMQSVSNRAAYKATVQAAGLKGILVMLDYHSFNTGSWTDGLSTINKADAIALWGIITNELKDEWNVFLADAFNEPHDVENHQWGEWIQFCEDVAEEIWSKGANWMIAVEGTNWQCGGGINCAWGENLEGVRDSGITFENENYGANRWIWSPHVYGADVTGNPYSITGWDSHWGYLVDGTHPTNQAASVIGEYGTRYTGGMIAWLDDLINYLISIDQRNTFFWCLNPNSGDTGGLLMDDWTTEETAKLAALDLLQPNPAQIQYNSGAGQVCVAFEGDVIATPSPVAITPQPTTPAPVPTPAPVTSEPTTASPTKRPTTSQPTKKPTDGPTTPAPIMTPYPTKRPTTASPTKRPTTASPTKRPTTASPTPRPTTPAPVTSEPTKRPTTASPTERPSTSAPVVTPYPTARPTTAEPTVRPTGMPTMATLMPTPRPTTPAPVTSRPTTPYPTERPTTSRPTERPSTPAPIVGDVITVHNWETTQAYYLTFTISGIDECISSVRTDKVQILLNNGEYRDADQYIVEEITRNPATYAHRFAWNFRDNIRFDTLLPITIRIHTRDEGYIQLESIITDLNGDSVFPSSKTCDSVMSDSEDDTDGDSDDGNDNDSDESTLTISNCPGSNPWWYSAKPLDIPQGVEIVSFEMKDSGNNEEWIPYTRYDSGNGCYVFEGGNKPYVLPLSFRISTTEEEIETEAVISSYSQDAHGNMAYNFKDPSGGDLQIANDANKNGLSGIQSVIVVVACVAVICIVVGIVLYCRKSKGKDKDHIKHKMQGISMMHTQSGENPIAISPVDEDDSGSIEAANEKASIVPVYYD